MNLYPIFVGLIAGLIADYLRKDQSYGLVVNIIIGMIGSWLGWFLNDKFFHIAERGNILVDILVSLAGASILLAIIAFVKTKVK